MGLGQWLLEGANWDPTTGRLLSDNTWTYKVPTMYDTPQEFDVQMIDFQGQRATNGWSGAFAVAKVVAPMPYKPHASSDVRGFNRSSRALGEPPLLMSSAIHSAMRQAVSAARCPLDGSPDPHPNFNMPTPATPEAVSELCWTGSLSTLLRATGPGPVEHVAEGPRTRSKAKSVTIHAQKDSKKALDPAKTAAAAPEHKPAPEQKEAASPATTETGPKTPVASTEPKTNSNVQPKDVAAPTPVPEPLAT